MTGWQLLLALLPSAHEIGSNTHGPRFRSWKPVGDRSVTWSEFWAFTRGVFDLCIERLGAEPQLWPEFAAKLEDLPAEYLMEALDVLGELELSDDGTKTSLWQTLEKLWRRHREYGDTDWAMSAEQIAAIQELARRFEPARASERHAWLFDGDLPDLGTRRGTADYDAELSDLQQAAIDDVWHEGGLAGVEELAHAVKSPSAVGYALGRSEKVVDSFDVAQLVDSPENSQRAFAQAFLNSRHSEDLPRLRELADSLDGRPLAQARLFQLADDVGSAWTEVRVRGTEVDDAYWSEFYPYGRGADFPLGVTAARHLAEHGRVALALDALAHYRNGTQAIDTELIVGSFRQLIREGDPEIRVLSSYDINNLMAILRDSPDVDEDTVGQLEWALLPVLDSDPASSTLQRRLARSPDFFVEVLSLIYRSDADESAETSDDRQRIAANAWRLLKEWKAVPGGAADTPEVDGDELEAWVRRVQELAGEVGRREVADLQMGEMLARSRTTADGAWPPTGVAQVLEDLGTDAMFRGFSIGAYNKRGVTSRSLTDGGRQEYALADRYRAWATRAKGEWPKTARVLRDLAAGYETEGRNHDDDTQKFQEGFGLSRP